MCFIFVHCFPNQKLKVVFEIGSSNSVCVCKTKSQVMRLVTKEGFWPSRSRIKMMCILPVFSVQKILSMLPTPCFTQLLEATKQGSLQCQSTMRKQSCRFSGLTVYVLFHFRMVLQIEMYWSTSISLGIGWEGGGFWLSVSLGISSGGTHAFQSATPYWSILPWQIRILCSTRPKL